MPDESELTMKAIGKRGGAVVREKYGPEFFKAIGKKGGTATAATHDHAHYQEIGQKGGAKGGARVRELIARGRARETDENA